MISTICRGCADRLAAYRGPVLVVSQEWARLYDELAEILKGRPDIRVVLERREEHSDSDQESGWDGSERRRTDKPIQLS